MNAETGNEPESPKKRGRIPQTAWPRILERYRAGATLSAIAREFECTPSAISYIVRKAEAAGMLEGDGAPVPDTAEAEAEAAAEAPAEPEPAPAPAPVATAPAPTAAPQPPRRREGAAPAQSAAQPPQNTAPAEPRRTLRIETPAPQPPVASAPVAPAAPVSSQPPSPAATPAAQPTDPSAAGNRPGARPEPTPPVDAVEARLRETARGCLSAYRTWRQTPGESSIQALSDAVHDLRKALARIEIDMSASRREEQAIRPIPIPAHRAARRQ